MSTTTITPASATRPARRADGAIAALSLPTLIPFAGLGLYGALRWGTMLTPDPVWRLLGMWALSLVIAVVGQTPIARRTWPAAPIAIVALLIVLPLGGFRVSWVLQVRLALSEQTIRQGLAGLPAVLVPYDGVNEPIRQVITIGAGVLLVDGALMLAFAPKALGELRAAVAALPLVVLAIVPAALARPHAAYLHGAVLFLLLAMLIWGERIATQRRRIAALATVILAAAVGVLVAPALDSRHPWLDFRNIASAFGPGHGERFDWSQGYGPLNWPRKGHQVLQVQARFASYWKTENLETFDGAAWTDEAASYGSYAVPAAALARWTETLHVTDTDMSSPEVVAAGVAANGPSHLPGYTIPGNSAGTWTLAEPLRPGDSYLISVYAPHPTAAQLRAAGTAYPSSLASGYLSMSLPAFTAPRIGPITPLTVFLPPFHTHLALAVGGNITNSTGIKLVDASPYGRAYQLAQGLAARSATPYDYAKAIERYLAHGYDYDEHPPASALPLVSFLFDTRRGYCQQFAGAMALLLRMGGVPARVATGFTSGDYNSSTRTWSVDDIDAHAWVEAWFPGYGWVTFDPTPSADPALGGKIPPATTAPIANFKPTQRHPESAQTPTTTTASGAAGGHHTRGGGSSPLPILAGVLGGLVLATLAARTALALRAGRIDPVEELERAFARCGRPLPGGTTLHGLEHRFRHTPEAAGYVRALRHRRYARDRDPASHPPAAAGGRRALRSQLSPWRGPLGWLRSLWALPPAPRRLGGRGRQSAHRRGRSRQGGD